MASILSDIVTFRAGQNTRKFQKRNRHAPGAAELQRREPAPAMIVTGGAGGGGGDWGEDHD